MKRIAFLALSVLSTMQMAAQKIDFDLPGKTAPGKDTEINFISWAVPRATSDTLKLDNGMQLAIAAGGAATAVGSNWNKTSVETNGLRVIGDEVVATNLEDGNMTQITDASTSLILTIKGMKAGHHTLKAYHNNSDAGQTQPEIEIKVDGTIVATGQKFTSDAKSTLEGGSSFIEFDVTEATPVVITFTTVLEDGKTYSNTRMMLNGLEFDTSELAATDPTPSNHDFHAGKEDGTVTLSWVADAKAVSHNLVLGTDSTAVAEAETYEYQGTDTTYVKNGLSSMTRYWWRVDEVDANGKIHKGTVWAFQPCHLAFPGAEGYGRYAIGGRGGMVYHVTSLSGGKEPGTLLYGLTELRGPRYIVFDVSGIIELDFSSHFTNPYATIAGQTAPGKGICIKASNINIGSDIICRHIRFKRGLGVYGENTGNAMGMTGADHAIVDHCTAAWGTDETVSGRGALNISFQYCMISEALGIAGHKNYADGTNHGYAATIDGRIGSWHHNLLVNCEGRNWSMGGGMDGQNRPIGGLDLFNNVCYNWHGRTTDGNCHAVNFVNNYYKMGQDTRKTVLFTQDFESGISPEGINQACINGNIRENKNHSLTIQEYALDKNDDIFNYVVSTGTKPTTYEFQVKEPLFESNATIHTAKDAMKIVTSYAGATMPMRDDQHLRNVKETLDGTWTYIGSKSGIHGEIDTEEDITEHSAGKGWEVYEELKRGENWDTDQDGMPNWYEKLVGSDPNTANQNDDPNNDGWTLLEDYLEFMAHPYITVEPNKQGTIDLKPYFIGFYGQNGNAVTPTFSFETSSALFTPSVSGAELTVNAGSTAGIGTINVTVNDGETTFTQPIGIAVTGETTGINKVWTEEGLDIVKREFFTLDGKQVGKMNSHQVYLMRITCADGKTQTVKILKN